MRKPLYFYGWNIVAASCLAHIAYAEQNSSLLGLFFYPLKVEFGWSRVAISAVQSIARVTEGLVSPIVGLLVDRHGARLLMVIGGITVGFAFIAVTQVDTLWQFYFSRGLLSALGFGLMGSLVTNTAISNWFIRRRGLSLALAGMGTNLSSLIMLQLQCGSSPPGAGAAVFWSLLSLPG